MNVVQLDLNANLAFGFPRFNLKVEILVSFANYLGNKPNQARLRY